MQTLQTRVLEPARRRQQERERLEQLTCLRDWVTFAQQQIQQAKGYAYRDAHLADPQVQHRVRQLLQESQSLLIEPQAIATGTQTEPNSSQAEKTLQQLLETINQACWQIQAMVPLAGGKFGRGYTFAPETIAQVQQLWFNTSDAIGILNQRQQLNRPSGWSQLRAQLMQPSHVEAPQPPVGTMSSSRINPLRLSPSSSSRLWVFTASVVNQASSNLGIVPYGRPIFEGANKVTPASGAPVAPTSRR